MGTQVNERVLHYEKMSEFEMNLGLNLIKLDSELMSRKYALKHYKELKYMLLRKGLYMYCLTGTGWCSIRFVMMSPAPYMGICPVAIHTSAKAASVTYCI